MPRSNRPRRARGAQEDEDELDLSRALMGRPHVQTRRGVSWNVQPVSGRAEKTYVCPGCGLEITPGTAHIVAWRADGIMGEADDLAGRRHWHTHCWKIG